MPGKPPFGGEIMSHDFVEAAFLLRAGWEVWMAPDLAGSYEEPPPTVYDHLKRDRRWAQGNLQHARVILRARPEACPRGCIWRWASCPISPRRSGFCCWWSRRWRCSCPRASTPFTYAGRHPELALSVSQATPLLQLVTATLVLLYAPKLLALMVLLAEPASVKAHGGVANILRSVVLESVFATLFAPVVMLAHSGFIFNIVVGRATGWGTQTRDDRALPLWLVFKEYWPHTLIGVIWAVALYRFAPHSLGWFVPLLLGLLL